MSCNYIQTSCSALRHVSRGNIKANMIYIKTFNAPPPVVTQCHHSIKYSLKHYVHSSRTVLYFTLQFHPHVQYVKPLSYTPVTVSQMSSQDWLLKRSFHISTIQEYHEMDKSRSPSNKMFLIELNFQMSNWWLSK